MSNQGVLAIDVGSSRVKLGWFPPTGECTSDKSAAALPIAAPRLPQPDETLAVSHENPDSLWSLINAWLALYPDHPPGYIASVHPQAMKLVEGMFAGRLQALRVADLSLEIRVEHPDRVGIDRLLNAVAVNRIRTVDRPAIVVDLGTACTVDLVAVDGAFEGGAIFPGVALSAKALHTGTAVLPELTMEAFQQPPEPVGKSTSAAISTGVYWGIVGAVRELVQRMSLQCEPQPDLFFTGGGVSQLVEHFQEDGLQLRHIPNLVLSGIAIVARSRAGGAES